MVQSASAPLLIALLAPLLAAIAVVGIVVGWSTASVLRADRGGVLLDGLLAPVMFLAVFFLAIDLPCRGCQVVERGWTLSNQIPHPELWAFIAACLGPALHQIARQRPRSWLNHRPLG